MINKTLFLAAALAAVPAFAGDAPDDLPPITRDDVEIVFVLDTTGSMGGLLEGAKKKIWYIARQVLQTAPQARVKMGLVAYRDKGDAYVTWSHPLTTDLDAIYRNLVALRADGGGDTPEHVNEGLRVAIEEIQWTGGNDVLKMIFLVGDAPAQMGYPDDKKHPALSQDAVRRYIYVNTIQCGSDATTAKMWKDIAHNSEGRFAAIPAGGGVKLDISTPWDGKLAKLAEELDATEISYGTREERDRRVADRRSVLARASSSASVAADRAAVMAKTKPPARFDLVSLFETDPSRFYALADEELPDEVKDLDEAGRIAAIKERRVARAKVINAIGDFATLRERYIRAEGAKSKSAFDREVMAMVETQMKARRAER
jgi:Mg-chelatase subunit ChlD